ncbi:MAG: hypothetical protein KatS3mg105_4015 [Gemmatales bacterium]|nr:MAG: hypothetical protein KatS3mg105_4015 [Gemmatales bacterium]
MAGFSGITQVRRNKPGRKLYGYISAPLVRMVDSAMKKLHAEADKQSVPQEKLRPQTQGEAETAISRRFIHFEKVNTGRGPLETRTYIMDDLVVVRLKGVLTPSEQRLAQAAERGVYLVKQARLELLNSQRADVEQIIRETLDVGVRSLYTDICTTWGEKIVVISLDQRPQWTKGEYKPK